MKNLKTDPRQILIGKRVIIRNSDFTLKFKIEIIEERFFKGTIEEASEDSPFGVGDIYYVSENEIKYHTIVS